MSGLSEAPGQRLDLRSKTPSGPLRVWMVVVAFVLIGCAVPIILHGARFGFNLWQFVIVCFTWVNVMICLWEICLNRRTDLVARQSEQFHRDYDGHPRDRVIDYFTSPIQVGQILSPSTWAEIWSSYPLFDRAYADRRSFGFWIDSVNGYVTLIPSIVLIYGMTFDLVPATVLGAITLMVNWQMLIGTVGYFSAYRSSGQERQHTALNLTLFVYLMNAVWIVFPAVSIWVGYELVASGSFDVVR